jgi:flagellar basal-body rod protein FlgB
MIDALFSQTNYVAAKRMLDATVLRQDAIASNLANLETPNYKRLDVAPTFETQLSQALANNDSDQLSSLQPQLSVDTSAVSGRNDGNTVTLENEMLKLNQNMMEHAVETQLVTGALSKMQMAITGRS